MDHRPSTRLTGLIGSAVALLGLLVAALIGLSWFNGDFSRPVVLLDQVAGEVLVDRVGMGSAQGVPGQPLGADDRVRTGPSGRAVLRVGDLAEIDLEGTSDLRVLEIGNSGFAMELDGGRATAEVRAGSPALEIRSGERSVQTSEGVFRLGVRPDAIAAEVVSGSATLTGFEQAAELSAGQRLVARDGAPTVLGAIPEAMVLEVDWPEPRRTRETEIPIVGRAPPGARVQILGSGAAIEVQADADGTFRATLPLREGEQPVVVRATDPLGEPLVRQVTIERDTTPPALRGGVEMPR